MLLAILLALVPAQQQCAPELCTGAGTTACPTASGIVSKPTLTGHRENVYFRNSARYPAEISKVGADGVAVSYGVLPPGMRRAVSTFHGDVWHARAVSSGHANGRLLLEHQIGVVKIQACECPQPVFVDCSKTPTMRDRAMVSDPVVFENLANQPVDLFYWNGVQRDVDPPLLPPALFSRCSPPSRDTARRHVRGARELGPGGGRSAPPTQADALDPRPYVSTALRGRPAALDGPHARRCRYSWLLRRGAGGARGARWAGRAAGGGGLL